MSLRKAGSNWVDGDRFFNREQELQVLRDRVQHGTHTLLTAQRRMGKTSLVRELLRRLAEEKQFETIFVDLEAADTPADAIAEIAACSRSVSGAWGKIKSGFENVLQGAVDLIDTITVSEVRVKLRAGIDDGNWREKGDQILSALAGNELPVVLAIDELPILVNRILKGSDNRITPDGRMKADELLSWLRKNAQLHRDRICLILAGSVSLEPILKHAGLSAQANIYQPLELSPWDEETAIRCLGELARTYGLRLSINVRKEMCRRLRSQVPHHLQKFFENLQEHLLRVNRVTARIEDVGLVYRDEMLSVRGQADMDHYEHRLKTVLDPYAYQTALELLTQGAISGGMLTRKAINQYRRFAHSRTQQATEEHETSIGRTIEKALLTLEHDGYLVPSGSDYRFVSGLLEDWWRARHQGHFIPIEERLPNSNGS